MKYANIQKGIFLRRPHRFGAFVEIDGIEEYVHVKNTGRCREILIPGTKVFLEASSNPARKTRFSIISAYRGEMLINIDSQVPNKVVYDALVKSQLRGFPKMNKIMREKMFGKSRFDIYYEAYGGERGYIEVKGVTLDVNGTAMFPDAPTLRGRKHIKELSDAVGMGFDAHVIFLVQYKPVKIFKPNVSTDPSFAKALRNAYEAGVMVHSYDCKVTEDEINIGGEVEISIY
ncbi:MAG: DNA/RNA nuclease SfsA [Clostridia bacterium]|nr:DNA/RNA nuclease SfsA [Clostridia bacterium]